MTALATGSVQFNWLATHPWLLSRCSKCGMSARLSVVKAVRQFMQCIGGNLLGVRQGLCCRRRILNSRLLRTVFLGVFPRLVVRGDDSRSQIVQQNPGGGLRIDGPLLITLKCTPRKSTSREKLARRVLSRMKSSPACSSHWLLLSSARSAFFFYRTSPFLLSSLPR